MTRLTAISRGEFPPGLLSDREVAAKLPALCRTMEGDPVDAARLDDLVEMLRGRGSLRTGLQD